ncbi:MAG: MoxR family ATPase [Fretibacterium sp.]|nr:MoxR family ATPase [Fretibacterium sp.]
MNDRGHTFDVANPKVAGALRHLSFLLHGKEAVLIRLLACVFAGGHLLLEDLPGLGKTTLALAAARLLGLRFGRVQCTNDLLPTDVTGLSVYKAETGQFEFHPGPVFNNLLLVDEINRATPKTQSALLEAMGEEQVTVDGRSYALPRPFFVVATQNPVEHAGTFPLPESQMDRFMIKASIGYPSRDAERRILRLGPQKEDLFAFPALFSAEEIADLQGRIERDVRVDDRILDYVLDLAERTRNQPMLEGGISPRGAMMVLRVARALAWMRGRDYVVPEDVRFLAPEVLAHRLQPARGTTSSREDILQAILDTVPIP